MPTSQPPIIPTNIDQPSEVDFSSPQGDDFDALSRDRIPVRSMTGADLDALIAIDRRTTGEDRTAYYRRKQREAMYESGVRDLVLRVISHTHSFRSGS